MRHGPPRLAALAPWVPLALLGAAAPARAAAAPAGEAELTAPASRRPVPAFEVKTVEGDVVRSKDLGGKPYVVSFWATWCSPCQQELTALQAIVERLPHVLVLAIATDGPETRANVRGLVKRKRWPHTIGLDADGTISALLNPRGSIPFSLFVDRAGRVAYVHPGYKSGDESRYATLLAQLSAEPPP